MRILPFTRAMLLRVGGVVGLFMALAGWPGPAPVAQATPATTIIVDTRADTTGGLACSLRDAITAANTDTVTGGCPAGDPGLDTIAFSLPFFCVEPFCAIVLSSPLPTITEDLIIRGGGSVTVSGNSVTRLLHVNSGVTLRLQDLTLESGYSGASDGGAISNDGNLWLENSTIRNNQTDVNHAGGAIFSDGSVTLTDSTLEYNAAGNAGALYVNSGNAIVNISGSEFLSNRAVDTSTLDTGYGGAMWLGTEGQVSITDGTLLSNTAQYGGALYMAASEAATLTGLEAAFNNAAIEGGAIFNYGSNLAVNSSIFVYNTVASSLLEQGEGGAIASNGTVSLANDFFLGNKGQHGGALFVGDSGTGSGVEQASIDHSVFAENSATSLGGGLDTEANEMAITVTDSSFIQNTAVTAGGGIDRFNTVLSIYRSSVVSNTAQMGGGLSLDGLSGGPEAGRYTLVRDSTIGGNTASGGHGGGVYNQQQSLLINVTIKDNTNGVYTTGAGAAMDVANTVLDNPGSLNCAGTLPFSAAGNFADDTSCNLKSTGDVEGAGLNPKLGPLSADAGSYNAYYMPLAGSPLIDTAVVNCSLHDQRGALRPDRCDKGAVEFGGLLPRGFLPIIER